ncbi:MAG TPA: RDD family protein [Candidatus Dormibacteraeota bacterium]|nr:RDD family protein [Candidatus Dormibacteraeota bacterium]
MRLISLIWVGLSFVIIHFFNIGQVGDSMEWKNGDTSISAGSHPAMLVWTATAIALFILLMVKEPTAVTAGIPTRKRRILAFVIDFWFSLLTTSSVGALIPLWLEAVRTGHFVWHFRRNYSVSTDSFFLLSSLFFMVLMVLYFAFPLTRGRQTVGCFIMRLRVTPPFGDEGRFTFKAALMRTFWAFMGQTSILTRKWDRDGLGRTWYDRRTGSAVVLVSD